VRLLLENLTKSVRKLKAMDKILCCSENGRFSKSWTETGRHLCVWIDPKQVGGGVTLSGAIQRHPIQNVWDFINTNWKAFMKTQDG
jgi:hypothetical protein